MSIKPDIYNTIVSESKKNAYNGMPLYFQRFDKLKRISLYVFFASFILFIYSYFFHKETMAFSLLFSISCLGLTISIKSYFYNNYKKLSLNVIYLISHEFNNIVNSDKYSNCMKIILNNSVEIDNNYNFKKLNGFGLQNLFNHMKQDNLNFQDPQGNTLFHYLIEFPYLKNFIPYIIILGADLNIKNNQGVSAKYFIQQHYPEYISFINKHEYYIKNYVYPPKTKRL